ncbi:MAG: ornithine cyclodeaminase family protein [Gemmatimonadaceae bacterium]
MTSAGTVILTWRDVAELLRMDDCIDAVEHAFRLHAGGRAIPPSVLGVHVDGGGFHVKTAGLRLVAGSYFAAKVNANFPRNRERFGTPTIQGVIALFDLERGCPLALVDSAELTSLRTAAATAVAARYLARQDAAVVTICGCGVQGRDQLRALARVRPLGTVFAFDVDGLRAEEYAAVMRSELGLDVRSVRKLTEAVRGSDVCVTCTTSRHAILHREDVPEGAFVAAVGADNPEKQEIDPELLGASTVVVDALEQCAAIGDLHHAIVAGVMSRDDVHAELAEVIAGSKPGRTSDEEIIVFDSTGTALEDVAVAAVLYERAVEAGRGVMVDLSR